ncbi:MAG: GNAT family N-acetyltransferase [Candidatus Promineifilaceae bacterium]|nr:GNAT family N-acetyltransferase [Candidatus Promineifilaceae bacterium]
MTSVTTYYLEMRSPEALIGKADPGDLKIVESEVKQYQFNRFLYQLVGESWQWTDKLSWSTEEWIAYAENDNLRTWVAYHRGTPAGYYELQRQEKGDVEIAYFGLAPQFIGRGLGGFLLSEAIRSAWALDGTERVWVHTCTLDHPRALQNYQARGMEIFRLETSEDLKT